MSLPADGGRSRGPLEPVDDANALRAAPAAPAAADPTPASCPPAPACAAGAASCVASRAASCVPFRSCAAAGGAAGAAAAAAAAAASALACSCCRAAIRCEACEISRALRGRPDAAGSCSGCQRGPAADCVYVTSMRCEKQTIGRRDDRIGS